jgi:hypothetical protein
MLLSTVKTCLTCGNTKSIGKFGRVGKNGRRGTCQSCYARRDYELNSERILEYQKQRRKSMPARSILTDSRRSDKKSGLLNDLTLSFIERLISGECCYCGDSTIRMTLDRIDNDVGHIESNVVPACIRCNYTRKNMPYEAWLVVARAMKEAREKDLFGSWTGRAR